MEGGELRTEGERGSLDPLEVELSLLLGSLRQHPGAEPQPVDADVSRTDVTNTRGSSTLREADDMPEVQKKLDQVIADCADSADSAESLRKALLRNELLLMRGVGVAEIPPEILRPEISPREIPPPEVETTDDSPCNHYSDVCNDAMKSALENPVFRSVCNKYTTPHDNSKKRFKHNRENFLLATDIGFMSHDRIMLRLKFPSGKQVDRLQAFRISLNEVAPDSVERGVIYFEMAVLMLSQDMTMTCMAAFKEMDVFDEEETMKTPLQLLVDALRCDKTLLGAWFVLADVMSRKSGRVNLSNENEPASWFNAEQVLHEAEFRAAQYADLTERTDLDEDEVQCLLNLAKEIRRRAFDIAIQIKVEQQPDYKPGTPKPAATKRHIRVKEEEVYCAVLRCTTPLKAETIAVTKFFLAKVLARPPERTPDGTPIPKEILYLNPLNLGTPLHAHRLYAEVLSHIEEDPTILMTSGRVYRAVAEYMKIHFPDSSFLAGNDALPHGQVMKRFEKELGKRSLPYWDKRGKFPSRKNLCSLPESEI